MEPDDYISSMPPDVISNILDRLPTQDAVRTDILARSWRFNWTMITQLIFDADFFRFMLGPDDEKEFNGRSLYRLLIHLKGPITKFVLDVNPELLDNEDINHWILFVSRNGIKDLTLEYFDRDHPFKLPTQLYSCMQLEHLKLEHCCFRHSPSFQGFPNLRSLDFSNVGFQSYTFGEFISRSPLLEILKFREFGRTKEVKTDEIAKLRNLKTLSLSWFSFDGQMTIKSSSIFQLMGLPKLQELSFDFWMCNLMTADVVRKKAPTSFNCLKTLKLSFIDFSDEVMASFVFKMICASPNLQTLEIKACDNYVSPETLWSLELDPKTAGKLLLLDVSFTSFRGSKNEVCLLRHLLACSPLLKKISIKLELEQLGGRDEGFKLSKKLKKLYRASPAAEIYIYGVVRVIDFS
ncbi:F-box domain, Leucine-rich repeat domain, L domain-like protein [Artemisia annua]|uniref:F-box domain, Leucine-rich repeat domain, L domain-like protein n=1 Tax=Artemisia annua TaxID=35608 RepID=A0A2U1QEF0_ARTAN|nr:F-box domain, Leucine-rich repeat domain, L domain-like protein [Artemisia annua]